MVYTDEYGRVEREFNEKMETLLPRLMSLHGVNRTADLLNVDAATVRKWNTERVQSKRVCVYVHDVEALMRFLGYSDDSAKTA